MAKRISAGIVLYRRNGADAPLEVLLAHPGGPYYVEKDAGYWSIPKGEVDGDEALFDVARREFEEETGHAVPAGAAIALGSIVQKGGKTVYAWAVEGTIDPADAHSTEFEMEWPPRSGRRQSFPEIDRVDWFGPDEARRVLKPTQVPLLDRLEETLATPVTT
jgi:predicted NUDIX family NTP pyrophosphohydrolase